MNNLAPMKNCPGGGGVQGNLNWMLGYAVYRFLWNNKRKKVCFLLFIHNVQLSLNNNEYKNMKK